MKRGLLVSLLALAACPHETEPPAPGPPTSVRALRIDGGTLVTWRAAASPGVDLTLVVRYFSSADGQPGATVPALGASFGSGEVVHAAAGTSAVDPVRPQPCKRLTYQLYSHATGGAWSEPARTVAFGSDTPTVPPSSFTAQLEGAMVRLSWAPSGPLTRVLRESTVVYEGADPVAFDVPPPGTRSQYTAAACNECGDCSPPTAPVVIDTSVDAGVLDFDAGHELRPLMLDAQLSADAGAVALTWTVPDAGVTRVRVLRRRGVPVRGQADPLAALVYDGPAASADEPLDCVVPAPLLNHYAVFGCAGAFCEETGATARFAPTLSQGLRAGGYVVWWRHATATTCIDRSDVGPCTATDAGWDCPANGWWKSCDAVCATATARQLTPPQSDLEIAAIRDTFASRGFRVGRVRSSEFCRVRSTAEQVAFGPAVETTPDLTFFLYDEANRCATAYAMLGQAPAPGTNTALFSHAGFACPVLDSLASAEAAVFKPEPPGPAVFIMKLLYSGWPALP